MVAGIEATRTGLFGLVHAMGRAALDEMLRSEAEGVAGPKGKRVAGRTAHLPERVAEQIVLGVSTRGFPIILARRTTGARRGRHCPSEVATS